MFRRVFVANRGEVAARVVRACRKLGIASVVAVSEADQAAAFPYLEEADEVIRLGPGPAIDSYLKADEIVQAARQTGCSALHPGWGFLAEDASFAALCQAHGIQFLGPSPSALDLMGKKLPARRAAAAAGLPVVPGSDRPLQDAMEAQALADSIAYPVALKANAGGGGRGIRRCDSAAEIQNAFDEASREAASAFGEGTLYLEKYFEGGRHIEFQILGDGRGNAIHLFDRECSVQRRHQKLLEEAPSPALDHAMRETMGAACANAAAKWNYSGAGTMEFLLDDGGKLWFLEMNTRLQVEHPVTEAICGLDLVEEQLRIAAGQGLRHRQSDLSIQGHAMEVRINAEDPEQDFRPAPGTLDSFVFPGAEFGNFSDQGLRLDSHLAPGSTVPPHYDSLLGKLIAHGKDRADAIALLENALGAAEIAPLPSTLGLQRRILAEPSFQAGNYDTLWLTRLLHA